MILEPFTPFIGIRLSIQSNSKSTQVYAPKFQQNWKNDVSLIAMQKQRMRHYTLDVMNRLGANCNDRNDNIRLVKLPFDSIVDIISYLNDIDWKKLSILCECSNRLTKYIMYRQCCCVFIAQFECNDGTGDSYI